MNTDPRAKPRPPEAEGLLSRMFARFHRVEPMYEMLREIRASADLRHLPVVILSTSDSATDVARAYDLLASSYMVKSRDFPGFVQQIDRFVRFWHDCRFRR